ncbi:hypothetical protein FSARC_860 [Fusarium sarcochroum]|uniref:NAD(P)-binding protein n=1 Tax=Fusarium sarcochroum TaxID=1208366 RepID=A0A8H4XEW7_9HYPO|nr:hypothetical protein FSARC_860 [Fusarium sarcochroum]
MPSYVITGASRGLGFEFITQLSADSNNTVIGFVRNKGATEEKVQKEIPGRSNLHIVKGDPGSYESLKEAVDQTAKITGGSLDYVIANAAMQSEWSSYDPLSVLGKDPKRLQEDLIEHYNVNVIGNVHLFNFIVPLLRKGQAKKAIAISSGMADIDMISQFSVTDGGPYTISKGALNVAVAKFDAEFRKEGILFMTISPGFVSTGNNVASELSGEQLEGLKAMMGRFKAYAPHFEGPITATESVTKVRSVIDNASIEAGSGGTFVSHFGNKQWL